MSYTVGKLLNSPFQWRYFILHVICHKATISLYFPVAKISCFTVTFQTALKRWYYWVFFFFSIQLGFWLINWRWYPLSKKLCTKCRLEHSTSLSVFLLFFRGCSFLSKCINAEKAGALAAIIYDNQPDNDQNMIDMIQDETQRSTSIPAFFLLGKDGYDFAIFLTWSWTTILPLQNLIYLVARLI